GTALAYERLLSTLPLSRAVQLAGVAVAARPDPSTAVLVLNVGARRGARSTDDQWLYVPASRAGFHRVGFYDAVDRSFLPASSRAAGDRVSIYVERALRAPLEGRALAAYCDDVVRGLQDWQLIRRPRGRGQAGAALAAVGIDSIGRYGRWTFQGIADSVREGLAAGAAYRS